MLWRTTAHVATVAAELAYVRGANEMKTWLGYARFAARLAPGEEASVERQLERAAADASLGHDAAELSAAWRRLLADRAAFLEQCAETCPPVDTFNGAREAVKRAKDSPELTACAQVSAATGLSSATLGLPWGRGNEDVPSVVCGTWLQARSRGADAAHTARLVHTAVGELLDTAHVRDVSALPEPVLTGERFTSPATWGDAELAAWYPNVVTRACRRLEKEFEAEASTSSSRLLLINDWPLTHDSDAGIAYLASFPRFGPAVPYGYRAGGGYGGILKTTATGPSSTVVLTAPTNIVDKILADQAARLGRFDAQRFEAGEAFDGAEPDPEAVEKLLRATFPLLPGDTDGEHPHVSQQIKEARDAQAAASAHLPEHRYERSDLFGDGAYVWTPDRDGGMDLLEELLRYRPGYLRLDVECGRRDAEPFLASVFGSLQTAGEQSIDFHAAGCHQPLTVPIHRVAAVTGAPRWERGGSFSRPTDALWEPYTDPEVDRYRHRY